MKSQRSESKKSEILEQIPNALVLDNSCRALGPDEEEPIVADITLDPQWAEYLKTFDNLSEAPPIQSPYGTHRDFVWQWVVDDNGQGMWEKSGEKKQELPVYGPVKWTAVGTDHMLRSRIDDRLDPDQIDVMNERCADLKVTHFVHRLGKGAYGEVWFVECRQTTPGTGGQSETVESFEAACKILRLKKEHRG